MTPKFITFEGIEACGKSTQIQLLKRFFDKNQIKCVTTREPGGTELAEEIRKLFLSEDFGRICSKTEILLNYAARKDHVKKVIKPSLEKNITIISDRFFDSTFAYQGYGRNINLDLIYNINDQILGSFRPDITFLLDIDVEESILRIKKRDNNNKFDKMNLEFHQKVRDGFLSIAKDNTDRIKIIDGKRSVEEINLEIIKILEKNYF